MLAITLVFLLLTTIVGVTAITNSTFDERIAGNLRDRNNAFEAAELALRYGEALANPAPNAPEAFQQKSKDAPIYHGDLDYFAKDWDEDTAPRIERNMDDLQKNTPSGDEGDAPGLVDFPLMAKLPQYVIQEGGGNNRAVKNAFGWNKSQTAYYTVTARGEGVNSPAVVVLQTGVLRMESQ
ncbi:pilus assembly PilX family protein [Thiorhodovibrio frisius]|uniref:pilus assembly PilX family protein n=1 Tax=Thiorhodovibrio frisius TaxID=631362 RepID=UPI0002F746E6|nr:PilX N-terminal domain-containing pilus assembly protein [Thiorhodovibrio frisius]